MEEEGADEDIPIELSVRHKPVVNSSKETSSYKWNIPGSDLAVTVALS